MSKAFLKKLKIISYALQLVFSCCTRSLFLLIPNLSLFLRSEAAFEKLKAADYKLMIDLWKGMS
jgi:hypothetical protein